MISLTNLKNTQKREAGFTLLELLIVIAIIAILSIALVFMLNPAETLKKARDAQRISDLKTVKTALGIMLTASSTPNLDNFGATVGTNAVCLTNAVGTARVGMIAYSVYPAPTGVTTGAGTDSAGTSFGTTGYSSASQAAAGKVDGTGWIPVNLKALTGGTPISSFPVDPTNTIAVSSAATSTDYVYRYACQNGSLVAGKPPFIFEINAALESNAYTVEDDKRAKDGGDHPSFYETGNSLNLLPTTGNF